MNTDSPQPGFKLPALLQGLRPLLALGLMLSVFAFGNPLAMFRAEAPPVESIHFDQIRVVPDGFRVTLTNDGPTAVKIAQVQVDDAYWMFEQTPSGEISRFGQVNLHIPYSWVQAELHNITVITNSGLTFTGTVDAAVLTPTPGVKEFSAYGLLGIYVGVIPVLLGMLWFPAMRRMERKWLGSLLALTIGLLVFLLVDTFLEATEVAEGVSGAFNGLPLVLFAALLTWLLISAIGSSRGENKGPLYLATLIALSIGLHNLGEGLAIGAAFALGEAALGSFLVIGFTMHNITEGIGIVAPFVPRDDKAATPKLLVFGGLVLLAGGPAILGAWIGGFAYSPLLAAIFLGVGLGAIWQVIVEVTNLLRRYAKAENTPLVSWHNLVGFLFGLAIMYLTALLVAI